jgi:Transposase
MKRLKYTEEQIAFALHQAATGNVAEEICRKCGISQLTFTKCEEEIRWAGHERSEEGQGGTKMVSSSLAFFQKGNGGRWWR